MPFATNLKTRANLHVRKDGTPLPPGKVIMTGYMNVYRAGWFHRENKPNGFDRHAGDFYATRELAMADIDPPSHYIDTVEVQWEDYEVVTTNASDAIPVPLGVSRKAYKALYEEASA